MNHAFFRHSHSRGNNSHSHSHSHGNVFFIPIPMGIPWESHSHGESHSHAHLYLIAPRAGVEPATFRPRVQRSTTATAKKTSESFQIRGPTNRKARLATVERPTCNTTRRQVPAEQRDRRLGRPATRLSGPRYCGDMRRQSVQDVVQREKI